MILVDKEDEYLLERYKWGCVNGKRHFIGYFADVVEAGNAAKEWRLTNMTGAVN